MSEKKNGLIFSDEVAASIVTIDILFLVFDMFSHAYRYNDGSRLLLSEKYRPFFTSDFFEYFGNVKYTFVICLLACLSFVITAKATQELSSSKLANNFVELLTYAPYLVVSVLWYLNLTAEVTQLSLNFGGANYLDAIVGMAGLVGSTLIVEKIMQLLSFIKVVDNG